MMRRARVTLVALLLIAVAPSSARAQTIRFLTASGAKDSTNINEPFALQLDVPKGAPTPATMTVTLSNGNGQAQAVTVTHVDGTNSYLSQTITVAGGAQKTGFGAYLPGALSRSVDPVKVDNGGSMTASISGGPSTSIVVYENATKQAIARNLESMDTRSEELARISKTSQDAIHRIDDTLKTTTDAAQRARLTTARGELVKQHDIAQNESAAIGEGRRLMADPAADDLEIYRYTDQYKLSMSNEFLKLSHDPSVTVRDWTSTFDRADQIARMQWDDVYRQFQIDYARGWYEATASFSMAGPVLTLVGGKTIYWQDATLGDRLNAFKELAMAYAMMKAIPTATDILGEKITGELGGYQGNTGIEIKVPGTATGDRTGIGSEPPAEAAESQAAPRVEMNGADDRVMAHNEASARDSLDRTASIAKSAGVSAEVVDGIIEQAMADVAASNGGTEAIDIVAGAELDIAAEVFRRVYPNATLVTDTGLLETIRSVRVKASLEATASPQRWTPAEIRLLHDLLNEPVWQTTWELENPFEPEMGAEGMTGVDTNSEPGYTQLLNKTDVQNLKLAASKTLTVDNTPVDPALAEKMQAAKQAAFERFKAKALGQQRTATPAPQPTETPNAGQPRPKPKPASLADQLPIGDLRDQILAKRLRAGKRAATYRQPPLANRKSIRLRAENLSVDDVEQLTPDEIHRVTPDEIQKMKTETREALPLELLNRRQLEAVARAEGVVSVPNPVGPDAASTYGANAAAAINAGRYDDAYKGLDDLGRKLVEGDAPKKVASGPASTPVPAAGSIVITGDGSVGMIPFGTGPPWKGSLAGDGAITVTSADGKSTVTLAPFPVGGFTPVPGGSSLFTFPSTPTASYPQVEVRFMGKPLPRGLWFPGMVPIDLSGTGAGGETHYTIPGREVGLTEIADGTPEPATPGVVDLSDAVTGPISDGPRDEDVQMFMGVLPPTPVPPPPPPPANPILGHLSLRGRLGAVASLVTHGRARIRAERMSARTTDRSELWLEPLASQRGAPRATGGVKAVFVSLGIATGDAFQVEVINDGDRPVNLMADGVVLEPIAKGAQEQVRKQMESAIRGRGSRAPAPTVGHMSAYCMEYLKRPPTPGTLFRIASAGVQARFAPMRRVLQAAERLQQLGLLNPDSDPTEYFHSIRQWALWTKEQGFTSESFGKAFVAHAKNNFAAAKQPWTKTIEAQISGLVPHRWQEIASVLQEADTQIRH